MGEPSARSIDLSLLATELSAELISVSGTLPSRISLYDLHAWPTETKGRVLTSTQEAPLFVICLERSYLTLLRELTSLPLVILSRQQWREELESILGSSEALTMLLVEEEQPTPQLISMLLRLIDQSAQTMRVQEASPLIHPSAQIHPKAWIHPTASIGAFAVIESEAIIEAQVKIDAFCYIGARAFISKGVKLSPRVTILEGCEVGAFAQIHTSAVIGEQGFGLDKDGQLPHLGSVSIGSRARIGALSCIDRATLGETQIGDDAQLDNLIQVGHNVHIGSGSVICAQSGLAGRSSLGPGVMLGGQVGVKQGVHIVGGSRIAAKSGVTKSLKVQGDFSGFPAEPNRLRLRREALLRQSLDSVSKTLSTHTAFVHPSAQVHPSASVHPTAVIGADCVISAGCVLEAYSVIRAGVTLGEGCEVSSFAVIGSRPQLKASLQATLESSSIRLQIGSRNRFHEGVSISLPTIALESKTHLMIGDDNLFMAYSHLGHDCVVGSGCILANGVSIAGHAVIADYAHIGGHAAIHQFVRIGELAFIAAGALVSGDVPPYCLAAGDRARLYGLNIIGLRRSGFSAELRHLLKRAYRQLSHDLGGKSLPRLLEALGLEAAADMIPKEIQRLHEGFMTKQRPICSSVRPKNSTNLQ